MTAMFSLRYLAWPLVALPDLAAYGHSSAAPGANVVASCNPPLLNDHPPGPGYSAPDSNVVRPGDTLTIYGHWYKLVCNDTGASDPIEPLPPVHVTLTLPGGKTQPLGEFTPSGRDLGFTVHVLIPDDAPTGTATISDDRTPYPARYHFTISA